MIWWSSFGRRSDLGIRMALLTSAFISAPGAKAWSAALGRRDAESSSIPLGCALERRASQGGEPTALSGPLPQFSLPIDPPRGAGAKDARPL